MSAVWHDAKSYREGPLLVLLALADWANDEGWCWPSVPAIADKARLTERQVYNVLAQLELDGVIVRQGGGGRGRSTRYRVIVAALTRRENPEMVSGFPAEPKPANTEAGFSVSRTVNPEMKAGKTLKSDASLYGRTVREPSRTTKPSPAPSGAEGEHDSDSWIEREAKRVCQAMGATARGVLRAVMQQLELRARSPDEARGVADRLIARHAEYSRDAEWMRFAWGLRKWVSDGYWDQPQSWPYDEAKIERARGARVGIA